MQLTRVCRNFFNPSGYLSRWVLPDRFRAAVDAVDHVGSDEGDNSKLDHFSRL